MRRAPKLRSEKSPMAMTTTTTMPSSMIARTVSSRPVRKDQKAAPNPRMTMAKMSNMRSMKIVPKVDESDTGKLIFSSQAR